MESSSSTTSPAPAVPVLEPSIYKLTEDQAKVLLEVKQNLPTLMRSWPQLDDWYIIRFCIARNWNKTIVIEMLENHCKWVIERKMMTQQLFERVEGGKNINFFLNYMPAGYVGYSNDNLPIYVDKVGRRLAKTFMHKVPEDDLIDFYYYRHFKQAEKTRERNKSKNVKTIPQVYVICDLEGLTLAHADAAGMAVMQKITKMDEANMPEGLKRCYVVNAPTVFTVLWALIKPWYNEVQLAKVQVVGDDYKDVLVRELGEEAVPTEYGGRNVDCYIPFGGDADGYVEIKNGILSEQLFEKSVSAGYKFNVHFKLPHDCTVEEFAFEFNVVANDVGFSVVYVDDSSGNSDKTPRNVVSYEKLTAGSLTSALRTSEEKSVYRKGVYWIEFDNSFSYFYSKQLHYRLSYKPQTPK